MYQNILVPIDGSDTAALGLEEAIALAKTLGARIRLIHVVNQTPWIAPEAAGGAISPFLDQLRSSGESLLHEAKVSARAAGVEVDSRLIEAPGDRAGPHVVSEARSWPAELIVCGTHGRRGISRLVMGSDAEYILHHSPVPILLIRAREAPYNP